MRHSYPHLLALCFFAIAVSLISPQNIPAADIPDSQSIVCPSREEILDDVARMGKELVIVKRQLELLLSGKDTVDTSPYALLLVDFDDEKALERRRAELRRAIKESNESRAAELGVAVQCALKGEEFREPGLKLLQLDRAVNGLRLKFLELPERQRKPLLDFQLKSDQENELIKRIRKLRDIILEEKVDTWLALKTATRASLLETDENLKNLAEQRALLEKIKMDIIDFRLEKIDEIEKRARFYVDTFARLADLESSSVEEEGTDSLKRDYADIVKLWRIIVDGVYKGLIGSFYAFKIPDLPEFPTTVLKAAGDDPNVKEYEASYKNLEERRADLSLVAQRSLAKETEFANNLILQSGRVRSKIMNELLRRGDSSPVRVDADYLKDFMRELRMVPSRWVALFYLKISDIKRRLDKGLQGFFELSGQLLKFLVFLAIPVLIWIILKKLIAALRRTRSQIMGTGGSLAVTGAFTFLSNQAVPYLRWIFIILAVEVGKALIAKTVFSEFTIGLPYIQIYCVYRIFRQLVGDILTSISTQSEMESQEEVHIKAEESAKTLGRSFLFSWCFLYAVESIVSRALVYLMAWKVVTVVGVLVTAFVANKWKYELAELIEGSMRGALGRRLSNGCRGRFSIIWSLPAMVVAFIILFYRWLKAWGEHFDVYKKISAQIFKQRIEMTVTMQADESDKTLPDEYIQWFSPGQCDDQSVLVAPQNDIAPDIKDVILNWREGLLNERSLAIYGDKGSGKSYLLGRLEREFPDLNILKASVPGKLLTAESVTSFLENLLEISPESPASLLSADKRMPKTLVMIDDAHNLFLAKVGGFQAFKSFIDLINAPTENLFWLVTLNFYSWIYLEKVFGAKRCFGYVKEMPVWSETKIRELILTRHRKTQFRLSYDNILGAVGSQGRMGRISYVQSNFYRLLWQQSNGAPGPALDLWLSALRTKDSSLLSVGLPEGLEKSGFGYLSEDELFVYSEVIRHGNLSDDEIVQAANLPDVVVKKALAEGVQNRILTRSQDGRYWVTGIFQNALVSTLTLKNLVYGRN